MATDRQRLCTLCSCSIVNEYKSSHHRRAHALPQPLPSPSNMDADHDQKLISYHARGSDDDFSSESPAYTPSLPSPRTVERRDTWCLIMHVGLVLVHIVLLVIALGRWDGRFTIALGEGSARLQTGLTIGGSAFCTVSALFPSMLTTSDASHEGLHQSPRHVHPACCAPTGSPSVAVSHLSARPHLCLAWNWKRTRRCPQAGESIQTHHPHRCVSALHLRSPQHHSSAAQPRHQVRLPNKQCNHREHDSVIHFSTSISASLPCLRRVIN
jgi:hypothetical protein